MAKQIERQLLEQGVQQNRRRTRPASGPAQASSAAVKHALLLLILLLSLVACTELGNRADPTRPSVVSISPSDSQPNVVISTVVTATLELPNGAVDLTTLGPETVTLTAQGSGAPVPATLSVTGATLILQPETPLETATSYLFAITPGLKDETGASFNAYTSTFTTALSGDVPGFPDSDLQPSSGRLVFTAGGEKTTDIQTLTLVNSGDVPITLSDLAIDQEGVVQFAFDKAPNLPATLAPGGMFSLDITFDPTSVGPQRATLRIASDTPDAPLLAVKLAGLSVQGQGGNNEPSLQWILDTFDILVNTGDDDPSSTALVGAPTSSLIGEELAAQRFQKAGSGPVTLEGLRLYNKLRVLPRLRQPRQCGHKLICTPSLMSGARRIAGYQGANFLA